jgi:YD repeat-containing protein
VFRLSVIYELERLKENALGAFLEFTWNDWGKVKRTLLRIAGIWTESFVWHRRLENLGGHGRLIKMKLPRNRMRVSGR